MTDDHINILLVEDSKTDSDIITRALKKSMKRPYIVHHAENMAEAESVLRSVSNINVILLDLGLPDTNGRMDTFERLEAAKKYEIPTLILTSVNDKKLAVSIVDGGAEDYIRKSRISREAEELCNAIDFALCRHKSITGIRKQKEEALAEKDQIIQLIGGGYSVQ